MDVSDPRLDPRPGAELVVMSHHTAHTVRVAARTPDHVIFHLRVGGKLLFWLERIPLTAWRDHMKSASVLCTGVDDAMPRWYDSCVCCGNHLSTEHKPGCPLPGLEQ